MAIKDYNVDPDLNVQISGINIAEGCPPSGINNAIRQLMADVKAEQDVRGEEWATQAAKDAAQDAAIAEALDKVGLPLGFEYTRLTGQDAPLGGVDYLGQEATRAMYADLWAWLNENKPDAIISESEWQSLYSSQNGNVAKYSTGDGSTTFRFPRVVGYFKGAESVDELGSYTPEGLPDVSHTHTRGTMNIVAGKNKYGGYYGFTTTVRQDNVNDGALVFTNTQRTNLQGGSSTYYGQGYFDASLGWTGETSVSSLSDSNPLFGNSPNVTPETVTVVMGVIAFGSVASIGEATEEGIVAELGALGAQVGALETEVEGKADAESAGWIKPFAGNPSSAPSGYLLCNGAAVSRTTYAALFSAIGTTYGGGDGSTTFNLPDLTDKFIQGSGTAGTTKAAGLPNITGNFAATWRGAGAPSYVTDGKLYTHTNFNASLSHGGGDNYGAYYTFNARGSNSTYGNSTTVQPPALTMRYYIKY